MALDPNIALQVRPFKMDSPINAMAQMYQLQGAQQANQLNAMQMAEYERARAEEEGARNFLTRADLKTPEARTELVTKFGKTGVALAKSLAEQEAAALKQKTDQLDYTTKVTDAAANIYGTVKDDASWQAAKPKLAALGGDPKTLPKTYDPDFVRREMLAATKVKDQLTLFAPKPKEVKRADGSIIFLDENPNSPSYGKEVLPAQATGMTPFQTESLNVNKGQLGLAQQKFAWEKANPGFELKEAEDGSIVGVNKRTLQAFPVTVGGAAPTAAAPVAGAGMPGARVPAIPGMTSVLDQKAPTAAPAAAAGVPLMGKGTAMTEAQSNAAMFGGAMAQAQNTIKKLEEKGTVKNAVVPGLLTGLAQMVPFGVGQGIGNVIESTFNADPTGLIGPDAAQQKLAQAQLAFATAYLRKTSGASFGASEVSNTIKEFFPLIGEGKDVIAQKAAARERAIEGMKMSTSKEGKKYIENYGAGGTPAAAGGGVDLSNPLLKKK